MPQRTCRPDDDARCLDGAEVGFSQQSMYGMTMRSRPRLGGPAGRIAKLGSSLTHVAMPVWGKAARISSGIPVRQGRSAAYLSFYLSIFRPPKASVTIVINLS